MMPWTEKDAPRFTKKATTKRLRKIWARAADAGRAEYHSDAAGIRVGDAAVIKARRRKRRRLRNI